MKNITVTGARIHNLKGMTVSIPKNKLVLVTGVSGSGKSSLVFDIIFEEGRRQYLRSLGLRSGMAAFREVHSSCYRRSSAIELER